MVPTPQTPSQILGGSGDMHRRSACIFGPPTLVGLGLYNSPSSVRPCVPKILNDYPLYFSEILHGVTTLYGGQCNILGFLKIILVASPGVLLWLKKPQNALKWLKMTLFAL